MENEYPPSRMSSLLKTATGKSVKISESARQAGEKLMHDSFQTTPSVGPRTSTMLKTARGGPICISEVAATKGEKFLLSEISSSRVTTHFNSDEQKGCITTQQNSTRKRQKVDIETPRNVLNSREENIFDANKTHPSHFSEVSVDRSSLCRRNTQEDDANWTETIGALRTESITKRWSIITQLSSANADLVSFSDDDQIILQTSGRGRGSSPVDTLSHEYSLNSEEQAWLLMQHRWIVWTFSSYEKKFPSQYFGCLLNSKNVVMTLIDRIHTYRNVKPPTPSYLVEKFHKFKLSKILYPSRCRRQFSSQRSLSPLQRCSEICCWLWPMTVCISVVRSPEGVLKIAISDGWFWQQASIDAGLERLVISAKLCDGFKIVVFSSTFSRDTATTFVNLTLNGTRLASKNSLLGYCRPQQLIRGLSLHCTSIDGGAIFGSNLIVVFCCKPMCRLSLRCRVNDSNRETRSTKVFYLSTEEATVCKQQYSKYLETQKELIESRGDIELLDTINDLNCSGATRAALQALVSGVEIDIPPCQYKEIQQAQIQLQASHRRVCERELQLASEDAEGSEKFFTDVLVADKCGKKAWVRFEAAENDTGCGLGASLKSGASVFVTNLKPMRSVVSTPMFLAGGNSSIHILPTTSGSSIQQSLSVVVAAAISELFQCSTHSQLEVSLLGSVLAFYENQCEDLGCYGRSSDLEILIADQSYGVVVLHVSLPSILVSALKKTWLRIDGLLRYFRFLNLVTIDKNNQILSCSKGDHSVVSEVAEGQRGDSPPTGAAAAERWAEDKLRFEALRLSQSTYVHRGLTIGCARALIRLVSGLEGCRVTDCRRQLQTEQHMNTNQSQREFTLITVEYIASGSIVSVPMLASPPDCHHILEELSCNETIEVVCCKFESPTPVRCPRCNSTCYDIRDRILCVC